MPKYTVTSIDPILIDKVAVSSGTGIPNGHVEVRFGRMVNGTFLLASVLMLKGETLRVVAETLAAHSKHVERGPTLGS